MLPEDSGIRIKDVGVSLWNGFTTRSARSDTVGIEMSINRNL